MNVVDYVIIGVIAVSVLFGLYRGFLASLLNTGGGLISFMASFKLYPKIAELIRGNESLVRTLMHYTDATSRVGDLETAVTNVNTLTTNAINEILSKVELPAPLNQLLKVNLEQHVYAPSGLTSVSDYVSQTILSAAINILSFVACFIGLYIAISLIGALLRSVAKLPVLKQLNALAGGIFGFLRGMLLCYVMFALVPLVQTVVPVELLNKLITASSLAGVFNNGNLILSIMNGNMF